LNADHFHRLIKVLADSGEAASLEDAHAQFAAFGVIVDVGADGVLNEAQQIIALTVINCAARSFLGNITIRGTDVPLTVHGFTGSTLADFLDHVSPDRPTSPGNWPVVALGSGVTSDGKAIVPWAHGSSFGLNALADLGPASVAACVAAGGLAVSEAFSIMRKDNPYAGNRTVQVDLTEAVLAPAGSYSVAGALPPSLWIVGLGHLGQAYAWTLGFMPATSGEVVLQDTDTITVSTLSTSLVSFLADVGQAKTTVVANWLRSRGWNVRVVDHSFGPSQRRQDEDPDVALFGVDNAAARRALEGAGFRRIVDLGLGAGHRDFRAIRLRTFPGASTASELWASDGNVAPSIAPAYRHLLESQADACGVAILASRAVGAPFVGAVAAGLALTAVSGDAAAHPLVSVVDLNLRSPQRFVKG